MEKICTRYALIICLMKFFSCLSFTAAAHTSGHSRLVHMQHKREDAGAGNAVCWQVRMWHCHVLLFHICQRQEGLFLEYVHTAPLLQVSWDIFVCCGWAECVVGGKAPTSLASARIQAFWSSSLGLSSNSPGLSSLPVGRQFGPENTKIGLSGQILNEERDL